MKAWFSSDIIRFHQHCFCLLPHAHGKKQRIKNQTKPKKKNPKPNCIEAILIKAPSVQPFCFCSNGEANEGYEKGNEINLCKKGKPTPGKGKQTLAKGKNTSAKGKPTSAKGKPLKNDAVQKGA